MIPTYDIALKALSTVLADVQNIDRVQLGKKSEIEFNIDNETWISWSEGKLATYSAFNDTTLPLAIWAKSQAPNTLTVLAYRPKRRLVLMDNLKKKIIKGYAPGKSQRAADQYNVANQTSKLLRFSVPDVLRHDEGLASIALEYCTGKPLNIGASQTDTLKMVGENLALFQSAEFQKLSILNKNPLKRFSHIDELNVLDDLAQRVLLVRGDLPKGWQTFNHQLKSMANESLNVVLCHRDLHNGQWLSDGAKLTLLDFDLLCLADPALDVGNYIAHITLRFLQYPERNIKPESTLINAFLDGYLNTSSQDCRHLEFYTASSLLRLALVYDIRPRWQHLAEPLTLAAENILLRSLNHVHVL